MSMLRLMTKKLDPPSLALLLTLGLFGLASFYPIAGMWGINHLRFLPNLFTYLYWAVCILTVILLFVNIPVSGLQGALKRIDNFLWGKKPWGKLTLVVLFVLLFYFFRTETHFLGDGYGWLSILGGGEGYYHKWTEPGSIFLVRRLQMLMGGYTQQTALRTFQILSILSGGIVIYNLVSILKRLYGSPEARLFGLVTLLGSGAILLFFGYVEFYHVLWAAATIFINVSLKYLDEGCGLWWVVASFLVAILMHMQALYFIGGLLFVLFSKRFLKNGTHPLRMRWLVAFSIVALSGILVFRWLYTTRIDVETTFLPLFTGRPQSPDYAILSTKHIADIINLVLLIFPGALVILALWFRQLKRLILNPTATFLGLLSVGSLAFLVAVDPTLGMARDWDLMSLTLLPPVLLLLLQIDRGGSWLTGRTILVYALVCICIALPFLATATVEGPSADRFYSLLRYYGSKNRGGWATLVYYYRDKGNQKRYQELLQEMGGLFPDYRKLRQAYSYLENGDYNMSLKLAQGLVNRDPYQPDFLQILGNVYGRLGKYDLAKKYYGQAIKLKPHHAILNELGQLYLKQQQYLEASAVFKKAHKQAPRETPIMEGLGLAYIWLGHLDSASAVADTLFLQDKNSPGGHLMRMVIALRYGNSGKAKHHFQEYLKYGSNRSDYDNIREYYSFLLQ